MPAVSAADTAASLGSRDILAACVAADGVGGMHEGNGRVHHRGGRPAERYLVRSVEVSSHTAA